MSSDEALADFLADTQVEAIGGGRYRATLSQSWSAAIYPFGGYVSAVALRAIEVELDHPLHTLRTAHTVFASAVNHGPVEIAVQRLRVGKRMSQLQATLRPVGARDADAGHITTACFGESRPSFGFTDGKMPDVPPPSECEPPPAPPPEHAHWRASFFDQLETRRVRIFNSWEEGWQGGRAVAQRWVRFKRPPIVETPHGPRLDPTCYAAIGDTMPPAIVQYRGPGDFSLMAPSVDLNVQVLEPAEDGWILLNTHCKRAGDGYATGSNELWSEDGRLLGVCHQLMYLRNASNEQLREEGAAARGSGSA